VTPVNHALTQATVIPYLQAHGLLPADSVRGVSVARRAGLNLTFAVVLRPGGGAGPAGWFVKQGVGRASRRAVAHEHAAYRELNREPRGIGAFIPALVDYDAERAILVLELAGHYRNLHERRRTAQGFSPRFGRVLGEALGCLHEHRPPDHWDEPREAAPPWILRAHRPRPAALRDASLAELEVVKLLQHSPPIRDGLDELAADWWPQAFVHGDFRWENCVVADVRSVRPLMRIVDFERAAAGDPALDVGAAFAEYIRSWLSSMPVEPASGAAQLRDGAIRPVEEMHPEIAALWRAYAERRSLDDAAREAMLARCMDFAAVRLIAAAFEETGEAEGLPAGAGRAVQLAESLFAWPWDASAHLIGIVP
jgi:hypothetical protein